MKDPLLGKFNFHKSLADLCFDEDDFSEAIENYTLAIKYCKHHIPDAAECFEFRGISKYFISDNDEDWRSALADLDKAITLRIRHYGIYFYRAALKYKLEDFDGAIKDCGLSIDNHLNIFWD